MASINISEYKTEIMQDIISTPAIVTAIDSSSPNYDPESPDTLIYENIFPFINIPETQEVSETYILMSVDVDRISSRNSTFNDMTIRFWCMSHKTKMKTPFNKTRIDWLAEELKKLFHGQIKYGYKALELVSNKEHVFDDKYLYRELIFKTNDLRDKGA